MKLMMHDLKSYVHMIRGASISEIFSPLLCFQLKTWAVGNRSFFLILILKAIWLAHTVILNFPAISCAWHREALGCSWCRVLDECSRVCTLHQVLNRDQISQHEPQHFFRKRKQWLSTVNFEIIPLQSRASNLRYFGCELVHFFIDITTFHWK